MSLLAWCTFVMVCHSGLAMRYNVLTGFMVMGRCEEVVNEDREDCEDSGDDGIRTGAVLAPVLWQMVDEVGAL